MPWRPFFNGVPREGQVQALDAVVRDWNRTDVFVLNLPVGAGKSKIGECIARWAANSSVPVSIAVPNNVLERQYLDSLHESLQTVTLATLRQQALPYKEVREWAQRQPFKLLNYYSYMSYRAYSEVVVFDESHNLNKFLSEQGNVTLWEHLWGITPYDDDSGRTVIRNAFDLMEWMEGSKDKQLKKMQKLLGRQADDYMLRWSEGIYRGVERRCLVATPLTPRHNAPIMWPPARVKKLILMSATFGPEDVYDIGLDKRRVQYIATDSPIPVSARPVTYCPIARMGRGVECVDKLAVFLEHMAQTKEGRGIVHSTYSLSSRLRAVIEAGGNEALKRRIIWHTSEDKPRQLAHWLRSQDGIFIANGLTEGLDLAHDKCRWQVIAKIAYPNLTDHAVANKMKRRPEWYAWQAVRELLQAYGRVSRAPDDYGETIITDSAFSGLYAKYKHMFPMWFREALR